MFKCGIDEAGVVDLFWWQELGYTDFNRIDPDAAEASLRVRVGDTKGRSRPACEELAAFAC